MAAQQACQHKLDAESPHLEPNHGAENEPETVWILDTLKACGLRQLHASSSDESLPARPHLLTLSK